jgi:hypothetical protein
MPYSWQEQGTDLFSEAFAQVLNTNQYHILWEAEASSPEGRK